MSARQNTNDNTSSSSSYSQDRTPSNYGQSRTRGGPSNRGGPKPRYSDNSKPRYSDYTKPKYSDTNDQTLSLVDSFRQLHKENNDLRTQQKRNQVNMNINSLKLVKQLSTPSEFSQLLLTYSPYTDDSNPNYTVFFFSKFIENFKYNQGPNSETGTDIINAAFSSLTPGLQPYVCQYDFGGQVGKKQVFMVARKNAEDRFSSYDVLTIKAFGLSILSPHTEDDGHHQTEAVTQPDENIEEDN